MRRLLFDLWPVLLLLLLWQIWVSAAGYSSIVLVSPGAVFSDLIHFPGAYLVPALRTLAFALGGLAIGMAAGLLLAIAAWFSELLAGITTPFALLLSSTPVVCLIPIVARLFGYESRTELIAVAVMTFFPSFVYTPRVYSNYPPCRQTSSACSTHPVGKPCVFWPCPPRYRS